MLNKDITAQNFGEVTHILVRFPNVERLVEIPVPFGSVFLQGNTSVYKNIKEKELVVLYITLFETEGVPLTLHHEFDSSVVTVDESIRPSIFFNRIFAKSTADFYFENVFRGKYVVLIGNVQQCASTVNKNDNNDFFQFLHYKRIGFIQHADEAIYLQANEGSDVITMCRKAGQEKTRVYEFCCQYWKKNPYIVMLCKSVQLIEGLVMKECPAQPLGFQPENRYTVQQHIEDQLEIERRKRLIPIFGEEGGSGGGGGGGKAGLARTVSVSSGEKIKKKGGGGGGSGSLAATVAYKSTGNISGSRGGGGGTKSGNWGKGSGNWRRRSGGGGGGSWNEDGDEDGVEGGN